MLRTESFEDTDVRRDGLVAIKVGISHISRRVRRRHVGRSVTHRHRSTRRWAVSRREASRIPLNYLLLLISKADADANCAHDDHDQHAEDDSEWHEQRRRRQAKYRFRRIHHRPWFCRSRWALWCLTLRPDQRFNLDAVKDFDTVDDDAGRLAIVSNDAC